MIKHEYTRGGQGVGIVVDDEAGVFFLANGNFLTWVEGEPISYLDGGCYAEEPKVLDGVDLEEWYDEGYIELKPSEYRAAILKCFKKGS